MEINIVIKNDLIKVDLGNLYAHAKYINGKWDLVDVYGDPVTNELAWGLAALVDCILCRRLVDTPLGVKIKRTFETLWRLAHPGYERPQSMDYINTDRG